jgi:hypothetical protein
MAKELEEKFPDIREKMERDTAESLAREGLKTGVVEPWEDGYRTKDKPDTFEWWYFDAEFDDGSTAVVTYTSRPATSPKGKLRPILLLIMKSSEGENVRLTKEFEPGDFSASAEGCDVHIGPNSVKGDLDSYELHAELEDCSADLSITRSGPSWRPGSGVTYSGRKEDRYFGWVVPVTYGTVEGTIVFKGEKKRVTGSCYHDHNWGNFSLQSAIDHWYWGRAHVGDFTVVFVEMVTPHLPIVGSLNLHTLMLAKGDKVLTDDGLPLRLQVSDFVDGPLGGSYPTKLDWTWRSDEGEITLTIRNPKLIEALDMLDQKHRWVRPLVHLVSNPYYYDFNADLEVSVDLKGVKAVERGRALYELMHLQQK